MRSIRGARVLRGASLAAPCLMSLSLLLAVAIIPFGFLALPAALVLTGWSLAPAGERRMVGLMMRAHPAGPFDRYTLAPVAEVLVSHRVAPVRDLLVVETGGFQAQTVGTGTLLVGRGMVEGLASGRFTRDEAAALIAHEIGIQRTGLTRWDPALAVFLFPYRIWLSVLVGLWQAVGRVLHPWLRWVSLPIAFGVQVWLGATEDPRHLLIAGLFALGYATYALNAAWERTRPRIGDAAIATTTLGAEYANFLLRHNRDTATRDRAIRILHHAHGPAAWAPPSQAPMR